MNWIVKWKVGDKPYQTAPFDNHRVAVLFAEVIPFDAVEVVPVDTCLAHITPMKDGRVILEVHERCEMLADDKGNATTFLYLTMEQLERVYKELGHYLFEDSIKKESHG